MNPFETKKNGKESKKERSSVVNRLLTIRFVKWLAWVFQTKERIKKGPAHCNINSVPSK